MRAAGVLRHGMWGRDIMNLLLLYGGNQRE